jgi:F-type H+-transporting ATPase subunit b
VLTAVVTSSGSSFEVTLTGAPFVSAEEGEEAAGPESDLNPIAPEWKEVIWGFGSFVVLALALRLFLFRKVRDGMTRRYDKIEGDLENAEALTASARADVAAYDAQVAAARVEAQHRVEAARATLEAERSEKLAVVNARIAEKRAAAAAEVDEARAAARDQVAIAVADVASHVAGLATGRQPSFDAVRTAVSDVMEVRA